VHHFRVSVNGPEPEANALVEELERAGAKPSGPTCAGGSWSPESGLTGCRLMIYMRTTTIRVPTETRDRLNELARQRGAPAGDVVASLVREADDRALLAAASESWERIAGDPAALAAYRADTEGLEAFEAPLPDY
jgi:predicted DNA-binding protein